MDDGTRKLLQEMQIERERHGAWYASPTGLYWQRGTCTPVNPCEKCIAEKAVTLKFPLDFDSAEPPKQSGKIVPIRVRGGQNGSS